MEYYSLRADDEQDLAEWLAGASADVGRQPATAEVVDLPTPGRRRDGRRTSAEPSVADGVPGSGRTSATVCRSRACAR